LLAVENVRFYSLQIDRGKGGGAPLEKSNVIDLTAQITDFADTAALMTHLDLVISVDTAAAHLAGAMGRKVWTLLPYIPNWRWGLEREDTPWYPTMRLFRQPAMGDWDAVIRRVADELQNAAKSGSPG
jgi:ADP-heptose:LPS heptosyltransferase